MIDGFANMNIAELSRSSPRGRVAKDSTMIPRYIFISFIIFPLIFGISAVILGKDVNWDFQNYHYYNAYAFVYNRLAFDIAPAQLQSFYNPILDLPFYYMSCFFPSKLIGMILGSIHGLNISLIFAIFCRIASFKRHSSYFLVGAPLSIVSATAPGFISEIGATMNDNVISLFVLSSLYLIVCSHNISNHLTNRRRARFFIALSGLVIGVAVGLKPTASIYAVSLALSLPLLYTTWPDRFKYLIYFCLCGLLGGILSSGFWWLELWLNYLNPLFPYMNNIFKSPYINNVNFTDKRFLPQYWYEYLLWPVIFSINPLRVNELKFADIRFALLFIAYIIYAASRPIFHRHLPARLYFNNPLSNALVLFSLVSFILWMLLFSIYRYLLAIELLSPLLFLILLERIVYSANIRIFAIMISLISLLLVFRPFSWGRAQWSDPYVNISSDKPIEISCNSLVIMLGNAPMAYIIPQLTITNKNIRFVRPEGNLCLNKTNQLWDDINQIVYKYKPTNDIYYIYETHDNSIRDGELLKCYGITTNNAEHILIAINGHHNLSLFKACDEE